MRKICSISLVLLFLTGLLTVNDLQAQKTNSTTPAPTVKTELYYFHFTRRCATCQAVESETLKAISALYPEAFKSGKITFKSVNLDEKNSEAMAKKCKAEGQSLLIVRGNKRFDLTDTAFMYARSNPEKLKAALKKTIDPLLNETSR